MYCVFNATTTYEANHGNPFGWPFESQYGYFCDQRDKGLFILSGGFINLAAIVGAYLLFVLYLGPKFMENRKPMEIKPLIRLYDFIMILVNVYLMRRSLPVTDYGRSYFNCKGVEVDPRLTDENATLFELFLWSRLADFLDTIWFVLRKKQSHISFLHVFHHTYVPTVAYVFSRFSPVSPFAMFLPFVNSGIHVVMYTYYLLATYPSLRPHLWWKRYLTGLQMSQFVSVLLYNVGSFIMFPTFCGKSQTAAFVGSLISAATFLGLFHSFYQRTYTKREEVGPKSNKQA